VSIRRERSLFSVTYSLVIFASILSVSQLIWSYQGADRAFLDAPRWITLARGGAAILFVLSLVYFSIKDKENRPTYNLDFWFTILAAYIFIRGFYIEDGTPKVTTFLSYFVLSLALYNLRNQRIGISSIQIPLRILIYGSILQAFLFPELAFTESLSRFGIFFQFKRFGGLVGHPSLFAFIAFLYLVTIYSRKSRFWKFEVFVIFILLLLANTASVLICLPLLLLLGNKSDFKAKFLKFFAIASIFASYLVLITVLKSEISNSAITGSDALNSRPVIWHWAFKLWRESPIFGLSSESQNYSLGYSNSIYWLHAHNQVLQDLLSGGAFRLLLTSIIYLNLCRFALRRLTDSYPESIVVFILLVSQSTSEVPFTFNTIDFRFFTFLIFLLFFFVKFAKQYK
jgi:O-antigen ligase